MRIPRIYHPGPLYSDQIVDLTQDATNHLVNVLRLNEGHPLVLFNGDGNEYSGELHTANKRQAKASVDAKLSLSVESTLQLHLGQGVSRGDRMEWVIQKAVELGVTEITPLLTERCGVKLSAERWEKKLAQWQKIIISACEQCGRNELLLCNPCLVLNHGAAKFLSKIPLTLLPKVKNSISILTLPLPAGRV